MPGPLSATSRTATGPDAKVPMATAGWPVGGGSYMTRIAIRASAGVWMRAFATRFVATWRRRCSSARTGAESTLIDRSGCRTWASCQAPGLVESRPTVPCLSGRSKKVPPWRPDPLAQSEQLGIGLALVVARAVLRELHPTLTYHVVDADVALKAGYIRGLPGEVRNRPATKKRPDYFLIGFERGDPGTAVHVTVLECKGTHQEMRDVKKQLADASLQVRTVAVGKCDVSRHRKPLNPRLWVQGFFFLGAGPGGRPVGW
jgi:hypothetical protein